MGVCFTIVCDEVLMYFSWLPSLRYSYPGQLLATPLSHLVFCKVQFLLRALSVWLKLESAINYVLACVYQDTALGATIENCQAVIFNTSKLMQSH